MNAYYLNLKRAFYLFITLAVTCFAFNTAVADETKRAPDNIKIVTKKIDAVDFVHNNISFDDRTLKVASDAEIKNSKGEPIRLSQVRTGSSAKMVIKYFQREDGYYNAIIASIYMQ